MRPLLSAGIRPTNQAIANVVIVHAMTRYGLKTMTRDPDQNGNRSNDGTMHVNGRKMPLKTKSRRGTDAVERVSLMLTAMCTAMLTKAPMTVPIATPIAPTRRTRKMLAVRFAEASATAAKVA